MIRYLKSEVEERKYGERLRHLQVQDFAPWVAAVFEEEGAMKSERSTIKAGEFLRAGDIKTLGKTFEVEYYVYWWTGDKEPETDFLPYLAQAEAEQAAEQIRQRDPSRSCAVCKLENCTVSLFPALQSETSEILFPSEGKGDN